MALNPFKNSNLNDLQAYARDLLFRLSSELLAKTREKIDYLSRKGKEKITIMFIPHSEKRIINFHVSLFSIVIFSVFLALTTVITSTLIINHSSTVKEVSKLKMYGQNSRVQVQKYKEEINRLYSTFQQFKPEITHLYSLTPGSDINSLWARGGGSDPVSQHLISENENSPDIEVLNMQEIKNELETTREVLVKIKGFLNYRKNIIENTPSRWPAEGYIISRFGKRNSPYTFKPEFHRGIDIEAFPGAEIKVTAPGKVDSVRWDPILGLTVSVKHKYGFVTNYSHCQRVVVEEGQKISKGETLGYVGRTGKTTRYICYYQIKIGTEFVDPVPYMNKINF